jgi:hypothetical protein
MKMEQVPDSEKAIRSLKKVSDMRDFYHQLARFQFQNSEFKNAATEYMEKLKNEINEFIKTNKQNNP